MNFTGGGMSAGGRVRRAFMVIVAVVVVGAVPATAEDPPFGLVAEMSEMFVYDRVSSGESLSPSTVNDARYWLRITAPGAHTITFVQVELGGNVWNTRPFDGLWIAGVTTTTSPTAAFLHTSTADIAAPFTDSQDLFVYMEDNGSQAGGTAFNVHVCLDQSTESAGLCHVVVVDTTADGDGDTYSAGYGNDCDDTDPAINPGATEVANGKDDDCDDIVDEGVATTWYADTDGDTYGDPAASVTAATQPLGHVADSTDCDDADPAVNPDATEVANGKDDDCDTVVDEGLGTTWYADSDSDTFGDRTVTVSAVNQPAGYVADSTDCDDADPAVHPGGTDTPGDGIDQDCSGSDAAPTGSTVTYTGASNGVWTNKKTTVSFNAAVTSGDAACLAGRTVTFTVNGVTQQATTDVAGLAASQFAVGSWAFGTYPVTVSLADAIDGACSGDGDGDAGQWVYAPAKPRR